MNNTVLDIHKVHKVFGEGHTAVHALNGVDLEIKKSEVVLIMGPSGSGKTTLLSIAGGILKPSEGRVFLKGEEISGMDENKLTQVRLKMIGFVFQQFLLLSSLTARENVLVVSEFAKNGKKALPKVDELLTRLGLKERMNDVPANLSGGEKQRVAIARALINDPDIILADEPTANLDSKTGHEVMEILKEIAKVREKSVLIVSHDNRIRDIADRILWLEDGKFKEMGRRTIDPVCGMSIERGEYRVDYKNNVYFFCSSRCYGEFKENPEKFI